MKRKDAGTGYRFFTDPICTILDQINGALQDAIGYYIAWELRIKYLGRQRKYPSRGSSDEYLLFIDLVTCAILVGNNLWDVAHELAKARTQGISKNWMN